MRNIVKYGALMLLLGVIMLSASAQLGGNLTRSDNESATVDVTISSRIMVDITPAAFSWTAVNPGDVADSADEVNGYPAIQIENIGSANITHVWFNATYPASRPFGTGNPSAQNAGNYIVLSRNASVGGQGYWGINQLEYNETTTLYYIKDVAGAMPPNNANYRYGRYHNASGEYFWMIDDVSDCTAATIYIGKVAHTKTTTGSTNFNVGANYDSFLLADIGDASYGYADITAGPLTGLCVAVSADCNKVFFSKWNADKPFHRCVNSRYAWNSALDGKLVPGDSFAMGIKANIPYGVVAGTSTGKIWAIVNAI